MEMQQDKQQQMLQQQLLQEEIFSQGAKEEEVGEMSIKINNKGVNHLEECVQDFWIVINLKQHNPKRNLHNKVNQHNKKKDKEKIHLEAWDLDF